MSFRCFTRSPAKCSYGDIVELQVIIVAMQGLQIVAVVEMRVRFIELQVSAVEIQNLFCRNTS